jgi:alpha-glucosidase
LENGKHVEEMKGSGTGPYLPLLDLRMTEQDKKNSLYLENHDQGRSISRFGNDSEIWRDRSAKLLAILQTTLSGTLFVYQGEELGMRNFPETWGIDEYKDVASQNYYYKSVTVLHS